MRFRSRQWVETLNLARVCCEYEEAETGQECAWTGTGQELDSEPILFAGAVWERFDILGHRLGVPGMDIRNIELSGLRL